MPKISKASKKIIRLLTINCFILLIQFIKIGYHRQGFTPLEYKGVTDHSICVARQD
jgi:hypothetical protein